MQPHSGAQANQAVFFAALKPGDTILGMILPHGGHLTHGSPVNMSGKWFNVVPYGLDPETELIDYDAVERLAHEHKPKLIIAGASAYSRVIDWKRFRAIADAVGALLMVDMAHYAGLIAAGVYPSPVGIADFVTSTTHKTLRGPRGGFILMRRRAREGDQLGGLPRPAGRPADARDRRQGGRVRRGARASDFRRYQEQVLENARVLAKVLQERGLRIVSGGTDCHMFLVDLRAKKITGKDAEAALAKAHITVNKNAIPNDPEKPFVTSGIRLGSPAITTRGFTEIESEELGHLIADVLDAPHDDATHRHGRGRRRRAHPRSSRSTADAHARAAMKCPFCGSADTQVIDSRVSEPGDSIRRRRRCAACQKRFTTYETVELRLPQVVKTNGTRSDFDVGKLRNGFQRALHKRPVPTEFVDQAVDRDRRAGAGAGRARDRRRARSARW